MRTKSPYRRNKNDLALVVIFAQPCEYTKNHRFVHFKRVKFMVCG